MSELISPESRIFHIGRECYVVYLGTQIDDIKPFLRIGNTRDIPDEVLEVLSTTVITDDHVGNPFLEILLAPRFHGRYLGDTGIVDTISRFFKSFDLPTDDIIDYREVEDGERRHMVWFYNSGNIHLRYDDRIIFDLHRREKEDRHFVHLYEEAKHDFLKNPLRYVRQDFAGRGIYLADGDCFWYERGDFISFAPHPGAAAKMMSDGIDPDFVTSIAYNLKEDGLGSRDAAEFIGLVKRMRKRRRQLKVITTYPAVQRRLKLLFPERRGISSTLEIADVSGKRRTTFHDSIISSSGEQLCIRRSDLPDIAFGWEIEDGLSIDIRQGLVRYSSENLSRSLSIPRGFPIEFKGRGAIPSQISNRYLTLMLSSIKGNLSDEQYQALSALESYLKTLIKDAAMGDAQESAPKRDLSELRNKLRRFPGKNEGPAWFFLSNCLSILNLITAQLEEEHDLSKDIKQVVNAIRRLTNRFPIPNPLLPFWGYLYLGEEPTLLWLATKKNFAAADIRAAEDSAKEIVEVITLDESPWHEDLARLLALIRSLGRGGQGALTEKQLAHLKQTEKEKTRRTENRELDKTESDSVERRDRPKAAPVVSLVRGAAGTRKRSRPKWPWILAACILLLFGGALLWDYMGAAPWGSILRARGIVDGSAAADLADAQSNLIETPGGGLEDSVVETAIDINVAPKTAEEIEAYLNVEDRVIITEADIHLAANEIAVLNGFRDLDYRVFTGADPDWILPNNVLNLPDGNVYVVRNGDTIWFLAAREVRSDTEQRMEILDYSVSILEASDANFESRTEALLNLRDISENSKAAQVRELAGEVLLSLRK